MKKSYIQPELFLFSLINQDVIATSAPGFEEVGGGDQVQW